MAVAIATAAASGQFWSWRGHRVHYVQVGQPQGDRPPLLLIHGFGASTDHWRKNLAGLQGDFQVWALDLLGFGRSAKPDLTYSGQLWRDQIHGFIETHIQRPVVLVGNSLGGYASLCVAADHPAAVAGVILLNSAGPFTPEANSATPTTPLWRTAIAQAVQTFMLQPVPSWLLFQYVRQRRTIRKTLKQVYVDHSAITDQLIDDIRRPAEDPGAAQVFAAVFKSPRGETVDALLQRMAVPLYLIWGEGDPWMNARQRSAQFRRHYDLVQEAFLQAGHCPHDEVPHQVNPLIRDWVLSL
ncbi:MAG: alpha/beta fold hydrolase [Leptolyngbya sp.]|nr:alpha/beta fold hydrolase [Leptolyngbya sp.]